MSERARRNAHNSMCVNCARPIHHHRGAWCHDETTAVGCDARHSPDSIAVAFPPAHRR